MNRIATRRLQSVELILSLLVGIALIGGCDSGGSRSWIEDGIPAAMKPKDFVTTMGQEYFESWLTDHGEAAIVTDELGVGVQGHATRLIAFHYGTKEFDGSFSVETEFRITLPDGREIVEFIAGSGPTQEAAVQTSFANFTLSTLHTIYSCFMNEEDPHITHEPMTIGGEPWILTTSGMITLSDGELPDVSDASKACCDQLSDLTLSDETHWLKVVYARHKEEVVSAAVTLDNEGQVELTSRLDRLPWPKPESFYMAKQFILLRPAGSK